MTHVHTASVSLAAVNTPMAHDGWWLPIGGTTPIEWAWTFLAWFTIYNVTTAVIRMFPQLTATPHQLTRRALTP